MKDQLTLPIKKLIVSLTAALLLSLALSCTYLSSFFSEASPQVVIEIIGTAGKNQKSYGTDIRILNVKINDKPVSFTAFRQEGNWQFVDEIVFTAVNPRKPVSLIYTAKDAQSLEIEFQKQEGSGIVRIKQNEKAFTDIDLYAPEPTSFLYRADLTQVSLFHCWPLLGGIFLFFFVTFLTLPKAAAILHSDIYSQKFAKVLFFLCLLYLSGCICYRQPVRSVLFVFLLLAAAICLIQIYGFLQRSSNPAIKILFNGISILITAVFVFYHTEALTDASGTIESLYVFENIILYFVIELFFYLFTRRIAVATILTFCITYGYAVINYYVTCFRGSPIIPADFFTIRTAGNVAFNYHYDFTREMFLALVSGGIWSTIVVYLAGIKKKDNVKTVLSWTLPTVLLTGMIISADIFCPPLDLWNPNKNIQTYGVAVSLVAGVRQMRVSPPPGYSYEEVTRIYDKYITSGDKNDGTHENAGIPESETRKPHIIAVMNEAFSDLSVVAPVIDSRTCLPYYHSLSENVIKGKVLVSTHGGGTANTEYEFLTGNTIGFIPGTIPYQQFVLQASPALPELLKEQGYQTTAIHPYDKSGYGRDRVYPLLAFDEFLDIRAFDPDLPRIRNRYLSDADSYRKVIEVFEKNKQGNRPKFIFNVTMQNHGDYLSGYYGDNAIRIPGYEGQFPDIEEYLTLIRESDAALPILIDYFSAVEEPVILILFGDHQPSITDEFYETFMGKTMDQWTLAELQKRFEVPFLIWANYDIAERSSVCTSANYLSSLAFREAGIAMSPYQKFLLKLSESIPAMNIHGYLGRNGQWYSYESESPYASLLSDYWMVEYNNVFAKRKYEKWFMAPSGE